MREKRFWIVALVLALTSLYLGPIPMARAATITVNTTDDEFYYDGDCSLREAIVAANTDWAVDACAGGWFADTITLPAGTYTLTIPGTNEEYNLTGDLDIRDDLTINGDGQGITIIQAGTSSINGIDRVLDVHDSTTVEINDVTIRYGRAPGIADEMDGGGIRNYGVLTLNNSHVKNNTAGTSTTNGGNGGGIYSSYSTVTLNDSIVSDNDSGSGADNPTATGGDGGHGGGIYTSYSTLTLNNSTVLVNVCGDGGNGNGAGRGGRGGGIYSSYSTVTLNNSTVFWNASGDGGDASASYGGFGGYGGGIFNAGVLTLNDSTVSINFSGSGGNGAGTSFGGYGGNGGGIYNDINTMLTLNNSTVHANSTGEGGSGGTSGARGSGGGIHDEGGATITDSTISDNHAGTGGGIVKRGREMTLINSTVSGNTADGGGGIVASAGSATLTLSHCTIANNTGAGGGGGILQFGAPVVVMNTIVADNTNNWGAGPDCSGTLTSQGYNLVEDTTGCTFTPTTGDTIGSDPNLGALADNGGPTYTHALQTGSPAIEQIPNGTNGCQAGVSTDQRGCPRAGGSGYGGSSCDIGAYEYDTTPPGGEVEEYFTYVPLVLKNASP